MRNLWHWTGGSAAWAAAVLGVLVAGLLVVVPTSSAVVAPVGGLVPSRTGEALGPTAVSGGDVFAGAPDTALHIDDQGAVFVYAIPATGSVGAQHEVATLTASDAGTGDRLGTSVAAVGADVVVGSGAGRLYVFAPPAGGWSGELHQVAVLSASDGSKLGAPVVSGQTIFAPVVAGSAPGAVSVFSEPTGGWSGRLHESATLTGSEGTAGDELGSSIAVSGTTVAVGAPFAKVGSDEAGAVYVFTEPAGGWVGVLHETAKLTGSDVSTHAGSATYFGDSVAVCGGTIVAALPGMSFTGTAAYVFTEPSGGWVSETQAAKLVAPDGRMTAGSQAPFDFPTPQLACDGDTIVVPGALADSRRSAEFIFAKPPAGWSGTQSESATLVASDGGPLGSPVLAGDSVVAGHLTGASDQGITAASTATFPSSTPTANVYVFAEPPAGWSGRITESAKLADSSGGPPAGAEAFYSKPAGGWSSASPSATLVPSGTSERISFTNVAVSGLTAVASGPGTADVFTKGADGWGMAEPSATLSDPSAQLGPVVLSGQTVAAVAGPRPWAEAAVGSQVDVFAEPAAGWSGTVTPAAHLTPSDGAQLEGVAVDGPTVVATGYVPNHGASIYVFTKPTSGWSGTVRQTARLLLPNPFGLVSVAGGLVVVNGIVSGSAVAAVGDAYLFQEPSAGWHGIQSPTATLSGGLSYDTLGIYQRPARGWSGVVHPTAGLLVPPGLAITGTGFAGNTVAVAAYHPAGKYDSCPCDGGLWLFSKPASGWSGIWTAPQFIPATNDEPWAIDQGLLFASGPALPIENSWPPTSIQQSPLSIFRIPDPVTEHPVQSGRTRVFSPQLRGMIQGRPRLTFKVAVGSNAPPISSITIALPRGVAFGTKNLTGGVLIDGQQSRAAHLSRGEIVINLPYPNSQTSATLRWPALLESRRLVTRIAKIRHALKRGHHAHLVLTTIVFITDAFGQQTRIPIKTDLRL